jgi:hypothetical protein
MDQHQHSAPPVEKLKGTPELVVALLRVLFAKDASQRFQSPAQLQKVLTKIVEAIASGVRLTPDELLLVSADATTSLSKRKPRKQIARWVLGTGLCLAGALIGPVKTFVSPGAK